MALPTEEDCDECAPSYLQDETIPRSFTPSSTELLFSSLPFIITFVLLVYLFHQRIYPILSGEVTVTRQESTKSGNSSSTNKSPSSASSSSSFSKSPFTSSRRLSFTRHASPSSRSTVKKLAALTFATTVALAVVLVELVLCEISDTLDAQARETALQTTVPLLLVLLIVVIPSLEIHSVVSAGGWSYTGDKRGGWTIFRIRIAWFLQAVGSALWILSFWGGGQLLLAKRHQVGGVFYTRGQQKLVDCVVENVGVIGISLMALLSGFASVSSPWQSFGSRPKKISEGTIERKQAGLDATNDMLAAKRSRLRAIEYRASGAPKESFFQKALGTFRGSAEDAEKKSLQMEISGLENMALSLSTQRSMLQSQYNQQTAGQTATGRLLLVGTYIFSTYCLYRIITTSITATRRHLIPHRPDEPFTGSDPINNILALFVNHYDRHLDQEAWTRQISFLLSGVMLFASFSSVLQTFHFFARFTPSLIKAARANLPLIVAQICATYVISAALLLRGIMPGRVVSMKLKGLGGEDMAWVDAWFEVWFLVGVGVTAGGIWVGRKVKSVNGWEDDEEIEMGKIA
ncbi:hypothetical protein MMC25_007541 [Agyrium rufum]|nr:hypothetical protein [Agyrium rufum]